MEAPKVDSSEETRKIMKAFLSEKYSLLAGVTLISSIAGNAGATTISLPSYNADIHKTSVSGVSSGAMIAVQRLDPTSNLVRQKVFMAKGYNDGIVHVGVMSSLLIPDQEQARLVHRPISPYFVILKRA
jgi:hypothetical protein